MQKMYESQVEITTRIYIIHHLLDELYGRLDLEEESAKNSIEQIEKALNDLDVAEGIPERHKWYRENYE